jgi:exodeoxyribonuclease V gamma subunit
MAEGLLGGSVEDKSPYDRDHFAWAIMNLLHAPLPRDDETELLKGYIEGSDLKRFQIASRVADIFDQYAIYRPKLLEAWEQGRLFYENDTVHEQWQFRLWRLLRETYGKNFRNRHVRLKGILRGLESPPLVMEKDFPGRIICFGISILPDFYIHLLNRVSAFSEIHLFHMNPSRYYWGDIRSEREAARIARRRKLGALEARDSHYEQGNALLAGLGRSGKEFLSAFYELANDMLEIDHFDDPGSAGTSLLAHIQSDITELIDRSAGDDRVTISPDDDSLRLASCHSPMREVEVLHDHIISLLDADANLRPSDILVLCPDIEGYAPYIEAVFGAAPGERRIPYSIADRSIRGTSRIAGVFLEILDLGRSRMEASRVLSLLDSGPVRAAFNLSLQDMELVNRWIYDSGIRWGIDEKFLEELNLPPRRENTWLHGLERMLLGYAMNPEGDTLCHGLHPFGDIEGRSSGVLGGLVSFVTALTGAMRGMKEKKSLNQWREFLLGILDGFFHESEETAEGIRYIRGQIGLLESVSSVCGFDGSVDFSVIQSYFTERFGNELTTRGFITGALTFCSMVPLRSIPFRALCLIGMNDDVFPRRHRAPAFDLMSRNPMRGDRNTRESDRYLFLETIMSAREKLFISYVGRSSRDNSAILPSNVVVELLDYVESSFQSGDGRAVRDILVTEHPLQNFSRRYFEAGGGLRSYGAENMKVARLLQRETIPDEDFHGKGTGAAPEGNVTVLSCEELIDFFRNTSKYFLRNSLGIDLWQGQEGLADTENFALNGLQKYQLTEELIKRPLNDETAGDLHAIYRSRGILPPGTAGELAFEEIHDGALRFKKILEGVISGRTESMKSLELRLPGGDVITMSIRLFGNDVILSRASGLKPADRLRFYITRLMLSGVNFSGDCIFVSEDVTLRCPEISGAAEKLQSLVNVYLQGRVRCVPFFPDTCWAFVEGLHNKREPGLESALKKASQEWHKDFKDKGELTRNAFVKRCFRNSTVGDLMPELGELACLLFDELYLGREERKHEA